MNCNLPHSWMSQFSQRNCTAFLYSPLSFMLIPCFDFQIIAVVIANTILFKCVPCSEDGGCASIPSVSWTATGCVEWTKENSKFYTLLGFPFVGLDANVHLRFKWSSQIFCLYKIHYGLEKRWLTKQRQWSSSFNAEYWTMEIFSSYLYFLRVYVCETAVNAGKSRRLNFLWDLG